MPDRRLDVGFLCGLVMTLLAGTGCASQLHPQTGTAGPSMETPTLAEVGNAVAAGIYPHPISLIDGEYQGEPFMEGSPIRPRVHLITELMVTGDLNGDGVDEALALMEENSGGTGHFLHIVPFSRVDGEIVQLGHALVGDRVKIRSAAIEDGRIVLETVEAGPGDGACCPTEKNRRAWILRDGRLHEVETVVEGTMSLADFSGSEWVLTAFEYGSPAPATPEVTIRLDIGEHRVSGSSGCNGYFGTIDGPTPREVKIGPLAVTKKMCTPEMMAVEDTFLKALGSADSIRWFLGQMAIGYTNDDGYGLMMFREKNPGQPLRKD